MVFEPSILDYVGKFNDGIIVSVGLVYDKKYYDSFFYYTKDKMIINVSPELEKVIGCHIEEHSDYLPLLLKIIKSTEPFESVFDKLEAVDIKRLGSLFSGLTQSTSKV